MLAWSPSHPIESRDGYFQHLSVEIVGGSFGTIPTWCFQSKKQAAQIGGQRNGESDVEINPGINSVGCMPEHKDEIDEVDCDVRERECLVEATTEPRHTEDDEKEEEK